MAKKLKVKHQEDRLWNVGVFPRQDRERLMRCLGCSGAHTSLGEVCVFAGRLLVKVENFKNGRLLKRQYFVHFQVWQKSGVLDDSLWLAFDPFVKTI